jgi:hypothetical protein
VAVAFDGGARDFVLFSKAFGRLCGSLILREAVRVDADHILLSVIEFSPQITGVLARKSRGRSGLPWPSWRERLRLLYSCIDNLFPSHYGRPSGVGENPLPPLSMAPRTPRCLATLTLLVPLPSSHR